MKLKEMSNEDIIEFWQPVAMLRRSFSFKMKIYGLKCKLCGDIIYSRARHDFHYCSCGNIFVDGGQDDGTFRYGWTKGNKHSFDSVSFYLDVTKKKLYSDWNNNINKYGWIYGEDTPRRKMFVAKKYLNQ